MYGISFLPQEVKKLLPGSLAKNMGLIDRCVAELADPSRNWGQDQQAGVEQLLKANEELLAWAR